MGPGGNGYSGHVCGPMDSPHCSYISNVRRSGPWCRRVWVYLGTGRTTFHRVDDGDSMDSDLLPELSGETWVTATHLDETTGDLPPSDLVPDLITSSLMDETLTIVREWVGAGAPPSWSDCAGLSPELRSWHLQFGNLSIDTDGRLWHRRAPPATVLQLVVPLGKRRWFIHRYHDSIFAEHLGVSRTVCRLLDRVYWPGLHEDV